MQPGVTLHWLITLAFDQTASDATVDCKITVCVLTALVLFTVSFQLTGETRFCFIYIVNTLCKFDSKALVWYIANRQWT